jgi:hypothetical protein
MREGKFTLWTVSVIHCGYCHAAYPTEHIYPEEFVESDNVKVLKVDFECAACGEHNFLLQYDDKSKNIQSGFVSILPFLNDRPVCPPEVPFYIAEDYTEACLVLKVSPKASAALSRRCLQNLLRDAAGIKSEKLVDAIKEVVDSGKLPSQITDSIQAIRYIGNFAAHPDENKNTGEIMPVEPHEAEWSLDILESLFDFYCVQPAKNAQRREALNAKFQEAGKKPPMK